MEKNKNLFNRKASAPVEVGRFVKKKRSLSSLYNIR